MASDQEAADDPMPLDEGKETLYRYVINKFTLLFDAL
jgi:hypothetical protein